MLEINYSIEDEGTFSCDMTGPDVGFYSVVDHIGENFWKKDPVAKSNFYELVIMLEGSCEFYYGDGRERLNPSECALLNPNLFHRKEYPEGCRLVEIMMSAEMTQQLIHSLDPICSKSVPQMLFVVDNSELSSEKIALFFSPAASPRIASLIVNILAELHEKAPGYLSVTEGYIERLCSLLLDPDCYSLRISRRKVSRGEMIFQDINLLIERNGGIITGGKIQNELGYNKDYLNRIVKTYSGMSLKEYCDYCKMQRAAALLLETEKSVNEIIEEMNFSGSSTFYRQFKKFFRTSPDEYRSKSKLK